VVLLLCRITFIGLFFVQLFLPAALCQKRNNSFEKGGSEARSKQRFYGRFLKSRRRAVIPLSLLLFVLQYK
jgi:hypothetical protein